MQDKTLVLIYLERIAVELQTIGNILKRQRTEFPEQLNGESFDLHEQYVQRLDETQNTAEALRQSVNDLIKRKG